MMARKTWIGSTADHVGEVDHAANWSPSGVPGASDDAVVDSTAEASMLSGLIALKASGVASFTVTEDAPAIQMGDPAATARTQMLDIDTDLLSWGSSNATGGIFLHNTTAEVRLLNAPNQANRLVLAGLINLAGTGLQRGNATISKIGADATTVSAAARVSSGHLQIGAGVTLNGGTLAGGKATTASNAGAWTVQAGANLTTTGTATLGATDVAGTLVHGSTGTISSLTGRAGGSFRRQGDQPYTITNAAMEGAFDFQPGAYATISNPIEILTAGKPINLPAGTLVDLTMPGA